MSEKKRLILERAGFVNVSDIFEAVRQVRTEDGLFMPLAAAVAKFEKESHGANIYGHDEGGIFSTKNESVTLLGRTYPKGANIPVSPANAAIFLIKMAAGAKSNGMGPSQITYAGDLPDGRTGGYFRLMLEEGLLPWDTLDNMYYGTRVLAKHYETTKSWTKAATLYNAGNLNNGVNEYGHDFYLRMENWRDRLSR